MKAFILMLWFAFMLLWFNLTAVQAKCRCICVNNQRTEVCENSWDVPSEYCAEGLWCSGY